MSYVMFGQTEQYDREYVRGIPFIDVCEVREHDDNGLLVPIDLNGWGLYAEVREGYDIDSQLVASLAVAPLDLTGGDFYYYQTADETEAFEAARRVGGIYIYGVDLDGDRVLFRKGSLGVRDVTDP